MVLPLSYRRPAYVDSSRNSIDTEKSGKQESISSTSSCAYGIPEALSFDKIINGGTCPVLTLIPLHRLDTDCFVARNYP